MTDGGTNTLASRGLEEPFFQLCCMLLSVFGSGGKKVLVQIRFSCGGVLVFWLQWEIVFGVLHILSVQYSCAVASVFGCSGK